MSRRRSLEIAIDKNIEEIKNDKEKEERFKNIMNSYGILAGTIRKIFLINDSRELPLATKYIVSKGLYEITGDKELIFQPFFNSDSKLKFLELYPSNTQLSYSRIFEKSKPYEDRYNKDLSLFTIEQIEDVLHELKPLTHSASHVNGRIVTAYIDWCIENPSKNANPRTNQIKDKPMNWFERFVDEEIQLYFSESTIRKIEEDCVNYQDMVLIRLLFEGVQGKKLAEIRNLRKDDINYQTGEVTLMDDDGNTRPFVLSERALFLIKRSNNVNEYFKRNGQIEDEAYGAITNLVDNNYVIRTSITRTDMKDRPVDKMVIYRRIQIISETLGFPALNPKNIVRSGIIFEGKKLLDKHRKLEKEEYIQISKVYNMNSDNWYPIKRYCNPQTINKLYKDIGGYAIV